MCGRGYFDRVIIIVGHVISLRFEIKDVRLPVPIIRKCINNSFRRSKSHHRFFSLPIWSWFWVSSAAGRPLLLLLLSQLPPTFFLLSVATIAVAIAVVAAAGGGAGGGSAVVVKIAIVLCMLSVGKHEWCQNREQKHTRL